MTKNWLHTPGQMASYISFRQTSHAILVVPSANNAVRAPNVVSAESRDNSDSDNNSMDYGSEGIQITVPKRLNFDSSGSEQMTKIKNISKKSNNETDFNLSCYYYDKDSRKEVSNTEISIDKTDPTYESIKSLTIPKIKLFKEKTGSHSSDPTYESLNSDLCFNFSRADGLDSARDDVSDGSNFRRSFESVKSGRDFTVFEINCDGNDEENDVFPENLSINSAHTLRHSYPGRLKESQTDSVTKRRNSINKCLNVSTNKIEEERYSPFPVAKKLSVNPRAKPVIASPRLCMIKTISGNLRPKSFQDSDENPVLNTPRSVPKIKIYDSDCIFNSSCLPSGQKDNSIPVLQNTESVSEVFDSIDDRIPTLKTYQTLRTIYSQARRAARTKKSLMSLPSVTEQTELELDQHLANNLYVKSTPRPVEEMVSVASSEYSDLCRK